MSRVALGIAMIIVLIILTTFYVQLIRTPAFCEEAKDICRWGGCEVHC